MIVTWIRWIFTLALLYGVYTETGIWTTISLTCVFAMSEVRNEIAKRTIHDV